MRLYVQKAECVHFMHAGVLAVISWVDRASEFAKKNSVGRQDARTVRLSTGMKAWLKLAASVAGFEPTPRKGRKKIFYLYQAAWAQTS